MIYSHPPRSAQVLKGHPTMDHLREEVLCLNKEISDKFVPEPTRTQITANLLIGLRRFKNSCRWKEFFRLKENSDNQSEEEEIELEMTKNEGLGTNVKPVNSIKSAPKGSEALEAFLSKLERDLLHSAAHDQEIQPSATSKKIREVEKMLKDDENVIVPTDKTNTIKFVKLKYYVLWVQKHLDKQAKEIKRDDIVDIFQKAIEYADVLAEQELLSDQEKAFLKEGIYSKSIPTPKLLIKNHKKK